MKRLSDSTRARPSAAVCRFAAMVFTSPPAEKWRPRRQDDDPTAGSASSSSSAVSSSRRMTRSSAFRAWGG